MSSLTFGEKRTLEKLLDMGGGYCLNFSDRTLREFVHDTVGKDIFDQQYNLASGSKANRLRGFWKEEPDHVVGKLLTGLLDYYIKDRPSQETQPRYIECRTIARRLLHASPVHDVDALKPNEDDRDFELVAKAVRESIDKGEPNQGLDRLHTFMTRYFRVLCEKHHIHYDRNKPLHSLAGEYIKAIGKEAFVTSRMAVLILKSSISVLQEFNFVRNEQSLAHANPVLDNAEAYLIMNNMASLVRFIDILEGAFDLVEADRNDLRQHDLPEWNHDDEDDIPF